MNTAILKIEIPGIKPLRSGKVRDIFDLGDSLLLVASDRVSAFDVVLPTGIPGKGKLLTQISVFWFNVMKEIIPNHLISADVKDFPAVCRPAGETLEGRSMLVKKAKPMPVECIVRGYLSGSGWKEYKKSGTVCSIKLPVGLIESAKLPEPLFTPSTKAEEGHDLNITFEETKNIVGNEMAERLKHTSLSIYKKAQSLAEKKGIIIADTKFEFGLLDDELILIDEVLTPDSSRFWDVKTYQAGRSQDSYDKQIVRDYLLTLDWNQQYPGPPLPDAVIEKAAARYREIMEILIFPG
ncbi:MAG: phosphoribosylaminoimidazolesuccinocarboxamide synthase [Nitrospirae bacterium]|nr:phosphoribosylaminoimidazolesuccinocarboxamide synthase [Nitrospirota bacterium]